MAKFMDILNKNYDTYVNDVYGPEGSYYTSPSTLDYNINANKAAAEMISNTLQEGLGSFGNPAAAIAELAMPGVALFSSPFHEITQAASRAREGYDTTPRIYGYDEIPEGPTLQEFGKALNDENIFSTAVQRAAGAAQPLFNRVNTGLESLKNYISESKGLPFALPDLSLGAPTFNFNRNKTTQPDFRNDPQDDYASLYSLPELDTSRFKGMDLESGYLDRAGSYGQNVYAEQEDQGSEKRGLEALLQYLPFGEKSLLGYLGDKILPKESPEVKGMKRFYRDQYGLTDTGQVASGIMARYNPVYGGALNMLTGGRFGKPTQFGLAGAMQKRIENILGRRAAQTDASRARVEELRNLQLKEMQDRADRGESLSSIGKSTFSGPGMAFEKRQGTTTGKGTANERNYGGR